MPLNELTDFAAIPTLETRTKVDLGAWATLRLDRPHHPLLSWLCLFLPGCQSADAWNEEIHQGAIAAFKTPTLRNLGQSEPYLHNGSRDSLESVVRFYAVMGVLARSEKLRNTDPEMRKIFLDGRDVASLSAFLRSLNEDYE
jgi:cytochrome c peroxidase